MAQVHIPESTREREQLARSVSAPEAIMGTRGAEQTPRRFGGVDVLVVLVLLAIVTLLIKAASRWTTPLNPSIVIQLSPLMLPVYAGYSLLRMVLAYILSLIFTLLYGHIAATNRRAESVMVPILDILQSIPILSFLPAVVLALVAAFPHSNIGLELASVILIFTSQAWNMTFSFYHAARTLPEELKEFSLVARLRPWQRFLKLEVPASMIGLLWNSMMSWAGGWFFLMASEQFTLGTRSFQLPGLGSYLQAAANQGNTGAVIWGLLTLIILIVLLDFLFWRPLVAWADKFKIEQNSNADPPTSPVLDLLRRSALVATANRRVFRPLGDALSTVFNRLQPLPDPDILPGNVVPRKLTVRQVVNWCVAIAALAAIGYALWSMLVLLAQVGLADWGSILLAAGATWVRTMLALAVGAAWCVPVGVAIGMSPRWSKRLQPIVQIVASIPATAVFPILLGLLIVLPGGLSLAAVVLMLLGTQWYILFNVIAGAMAVPTDLKEATVIYHVTRWQRWRTLILPAVFPYLVTGLLTASGGAWNASIVSEYVQYHGQTKSTIGLGASIASAANAQNFPVLLAATLVMAVFVVIVNRFLWKRMYALAARRYTLG
jgi:NitT/TauT family transport system permease protein